MWVVSNILTKWLEELELLEARGCYSSNNDAKTPVQFNELKEYVFFLNKQRERNSAQVRLKSLDNMINFSI